MSQFYLHGDIKWKNGMNSLVESQSKKELVTNRSTSFHLQYLYQPGRYSSIIILISICSLFLRV